MASTMHIQTASRLEGIGEYYFSRKLTEIAELNRSGQPVINLGIGSPDLPPHPSVIATLQEYAAGAGNHAYQGYKGVPALRQAFAGWYNRWYGVELDPDRELLPLIGSKEGIMHLCMTYLNAGDLALVPDPGYPTYASAVRLAGGIPLEYPLKAESGWIPRRQELQDLVESHPGVKMLFVNFPHMPTGRLPEPGLFEWLVDFARENALLICHDNPYSFILNDKPASMLAVPGAREVVVELNSLSKSHNMAGWRVGVLCGQAERIADVLRFKSNMDSGMFLPVQMAAVTALGLGEEWYRSLNEVYAGRKSLAVELLGLLGTRAEEDQAGMFVWAPVPVHYGDGYALSDAVLHGARVFLTPGGIFGSQGRGYIRLSLCSPESVYRQAIERIKNMKP